MGTVAPRRTQVERRAASRAKLLTAALECLAERGYAGTTLPEIVSRAGLSNGGLWRHFRSKAELLAAAALFAESRLAEDDDQPAVPGATAGERLDAAVERVWRHVTSPPFEAQLELLVASRTDPELAGALLSKDRDAAELFFDAFTRFVGPELAAHPDFRRNTRLLALTLYGTALTERLRPERPSRLLLAELKELARQLFGVPG